MASDERATSEGSLKQDELNSNKKVATDGHQERPSESKPWTLNDFKVGHPLGRGTFGTVFIAKEKSTERIVALKILYKRKIEDYKMENQLKREIQIQFNLRHPNILQLLAFFHDETRVYVVLDYAANGELFGLLNAQPGRKIHESLAAKFIRQLTSALVYCHRLNVIHRDVKPENVLLDSKCNAKLADFGWSVVSDNSKRTTICGTYDYLPPEITSSGTHDHRVDIWTTGVLLFELLTGQTPFFNENQIALLSNIRNCRMIVPKNVSPEATDLVLKLIKLNPEERLPLKSVLEHQWLVRMKELGQEDVAAIEALTFLRSKPEK